MGHLATCARFRVGASRVLAVFVLACATSCTTQPPPPVSRPAMVRIGVTVSPSGAGGDLGVGQLSWLITGEGLTRTGRTGKWQPNLAESWTESHDGLTITVALRQGLRFSDGSPLTATEAAASLENSRRLARDLFQYPTLHDIARIEVVGPETLVLKGSGENAPTTGAYLRAFSTDGKTSFVANPHYHAGAATITRVEQHNYASLRQAWASLMRGEIDFLFDVPHEARSFVERESTVQLFSSLRPYVYTLAFNTRAGVFRNSAIRVALNYAVDRNAILKQVLHGYGVAAQGPIWVEYYAAPNGVVSPYRYDAARADAILTGAGIPKAVLTAGGGGVPARLRFTCVVPASQIHENIALVLQKQFFDLGIDMRIDLVSPAEIVKRVTNGTYDAVLLDLAGGPTLLRTYQFWHSSGAGSPFRFGNGEADAAFDLLYHAPDEAALRHAVRRIQERMDADPPAIFLFWPEGARAVSRRFVVPTGDWDILTNIWRWRLAQ
jgi:peptide/nickel transport system substrate-binding protein